ncbi:MAG: ATP-binding protein [Nostoc sp.]
MQLTGNADSTVGMSESVKEKIFDHLFTTKGVGKAKGLELAIANSIFVEKYGGTLNVNSTLTNSHSDLEITNKNQYFL